MTKEELYEDYITNNMLRKDICEKYNLTLKQVTTLLSKYNISKNNVPAIEKDRLIELYINKNKTIEDIINITGLSYNKIRYYIKKYNIKKDRVLIQKTIEDNNLKKYGCKNAGWTEKAQEKIKETCMQKYGVNAPLGAKEIQDKIKETCIQKYGVDNNLKRKEIQDRIKCTIEEKYGVKCACLTDQCQSAMVTKDSVPNLVFKEILDSLNISYEREFKIENRSYDFKINNTLIEINPTATHNSTFGVHGKSPIDADYHLNKLLLANKYNYKCIHIFDWEDENLIANMFIDKEKIYARKCELKEVSEDDCNKFLNENHIQGMCKNQSIRLGLYYNNKLIEVMTFGKPRYNKKYEYELLRLCTLKGYYIIGGSERLYKYFIKMYDPETVISYCDNSKFTGDVYKKLGFNLKTFGDPTIHWYNMKTKKHITDNLLRQRGYNQLFHTNYNKSNEELMLENGFVKIYDCGQSTYIYERQM